MNERKTVNCKFAHSDSVVCARVRRTFMFVYSISSPILFAPDYCALLLLAHISTVHTQSTRIHPFNSIQFRFSLFLCRFICVCAQFFFMIILFVCLFCENQKHTETHTHARTHIQCIYNKCDDVPNKKTYATRTESFTTEKCLRNMNETLIFDVDDDDDYDDDANDKLNDSDATAAAASVVVVSRCFSRCSNWKFQSI